MMLSFVLVYVFFTAFLENDKSVIQGVLVCSLLVFIYIYLMQKLGDVTSTDEALSKIWSMVICIFPVYLLHRIIYKFDDRQMSFLIKIIIGMFAITALLTSKELISNPSACRTFTIQTSLYKRNVGHFDFIYAIPVFIVFFQLLKNRLIRSRVILSLLEILLIITLLLSGYTLALLTLIICEVYCFLKKQGSSRNVMFAFILLGVVIMIFGPLMLQGLISIIPHKSSAIRLSELYNALYQDDASGYNMNGRIDLYIMAIQAFLSGFLSGNRELGFSPHASFLSIAAHTGIWGVICIIALFNKLRRTVYKYTGSCHIAFNAAYLAFLITGFTNPLLNCYLHCFAVFCVIPLAIYRYGDFGLKGDTYGIEYGE
jgi:hypothetical protein